MQHQRERRVGDQRRALVPGDQRQLLRISYLTVNATAGQPLVVNFDPDHSQAFDNVILNGFEIDRTSAPGTVAVSPYPTDGDEHVFANNDAPASAAAAACVCPSRPLQEVAADIRRL